MRWRIHPSPAQAELPLSHQERRRASLRVHTRVSGWCSPSEHACVPVGMPHGLGSQAGSALCLQARATAGTAGPREGVRGTPDHRVHGTGAPRLDDKHPLQVRLGGITRQVTPAAAGGEWRPGRRSLGQTCAPGRDPRRQREVSGKPSADLSDRNHLWPVWLGGWRVQLSLGGGGSVSWGRQWAASRPVPSRQSTGRALKTQGRVARWPGFGPLARGPANTQPRPRGQERHVGTHTCHSFRHDVGV